jgi:ABC-type phosphate transport system permease subunit
VRCVADLCVLLPTLLLCFIVIFVVRARGSKLWRFLTNRKRYKQRKAVVFNLIFGSLERG